VEIRPRAAILAASGRTAAATAGARGGDRRLRDGARQTGRFQQPLHDGADRLQAAVAATFLR
jgi:hypothetical protein